MPKKPPITMRVIKPADVVVSFGGQRKQRLPLFPVVSMFTLLGLELAMGLTEGALKAVGKSRQASVKSAVASLE